MKSGVIVIILLISNVLLADTQAVNAAWVEGGTPVCAMTNRQANPRIMPDGAGGAIIAWHDGRDGYYYDIYALRVDDDGELPLVTRLLSYSAYGAGRDIVVEWALAQAGMHVRFFYLANALRNRIGHDAAHARHALSELSESVQSTDDVLLLPSRDDEGDTGNLRRIGTQGVPGARRLAGAGTPRGAVGWLQRGGRSSPRGHLLLQAHDVDGQAGTQDCNCTVKNQGIPIYSLTIKEKPL